MLAKCERNDYYNRKFEKLKDWWQMNDDGIDFLEWNNFKMLKNQYADTKYYREALAECGYLNTYVNPKR